MLLTHSKCVIWNVCLATSVTLRYCYDERVLQSSNSCTKGKARAVTAGGVSTRRRWLTDWRRWKFGPDLKSKPPFTRMEIS